MQQLLIFFFRPFGLLDGGVEPFKPSVESVNINKRGKLNKLTNVNDQLKEWK